MNDTILILLTILMAANVVLLGTIVFRPILLQRRLRMFADSLPSVSAAGSSGASDGSGGVRADRSSREWVTLDAAPIDTSPPPVRADALTGLLLPGEWNRIVGDEDARIRRYGRPGTIVLIELDGLDRLIAALGADAGERVLPAVADTLSRHARGADQLARLGLARFAVLLPETGEVEAVNYVERIRSACELWLESGAIALRLAIGWAAPPLDGDLSDAFAMAEDRMFVELRQNDRRPAEPAAPVARLTLGLEGSPSPA